MNQTRRRVRAGRGIVASGRVYYVYIEPEEFLLKRYGLRVESKILIVDILDIKEADFGWMVQGDETL